LGSGKWLLFALKFGFHGAFLTSDASVYLGKNWWIVLMNICIFNLELAFLGPMSF